MRRAVWSVVGSCLVGCGFTLSVDPAPGGADGGDLGASSGTTPPSSSGGSGSGGSSGSGASGSSGAGSSGAPTLPDASSSGSSGDPTLPDGGQCQSLIELNGAFCGGDAACTRAENATNLVTLPTGTMSVSASGCNAGTINGGHVQIARTLPGVFRVSTHFRVKKDQAPIVIVLLGANAPNSIDQSACESLQDGDVAVSLYRETAGAASQWKLQAQSKSQCQLPASGDSLGAAPENTDFDITLAYDGTTLTASGTWSQGGAGAVLGPSVVAGSPVGADAKLAFAAYTLDDGMPSRKSVEVDKLHVLCP